jgi:cell envelope opacity-associated protein A
VTRVLLVPLLVLQATLTMVAQQPAKTTNAKPAKTTAPANDIFSGTVTASLPDSVTVVRKVPARADEARVFVVDKDTKIEGKLKTNARVTVRFRTDADGAVHALRIIVRVDGKTTAGPGRTNPGQ